MNTRKQDMINALSGQAIPRRVPTWELEFQLWNEFSDQEFVIGEAFVALSPGEQEKALAQDAEVIAGVCEKLGFSALTIPPGFWESAPGKPAYLWLPEDARERLLKQLQALCGDSLLFVAHTGAVVGMPEAAEYEEFAFKLYDEPEEVDAMARRYCDGAKAAICRWADLGVQGFLSTADQADNKNTYFNPAQLERFIYPYLKEWADAGRAAGGYTILHSDGNILPMFEGVIACGVDALQALDPTAGISMADVKAKAGGRICLCGNVDCGLMLSGSAEEIYEGAKRTLEAGMPGGRFVFGASNAIEPQAGAQRFLAMHRAWVDHGTYPEEKLPAANLS